ncbi:MULTISPECIES: hypothetical protein [Pectobacterium]|uniref:hypothetical protein n=1 Tax=Pectobacterium TaxID=122277 RepID=UPI001F29CE39|nr:MULTISPECIES: hypothetical protein [Pectobacterium]MCE9730630.1 hypothetical protein [Pectobacterium sp. IFB5596]MCL6379805.1 hypothetical protein [Pectobacterium brasiliense]GKV78635.1 hypothetical protein PEC106568_38080 [Pectobacterium carotovorum subsp. carotovorum]
MGKLTKKEREWVADVQDVLNRCPSPEKIGFYTTGDAYIYLYDLRKYKDVVQALDTGKASDWSPACRVAGAHIEGNIEFPSPVEATAG